MLNEPAPGFRYRRDPRTGEAYVETTLRGEPLTDLPIFNKGTAFPLEERDALGLRGLLPPHAVTLEDQVHRVMAHYDRQESDLERYVTLVALLDRNETLFYRVLLDHFERLMPIVYTPTVGEACRRFGYVYRRPRGLYFTLDDVGRMEDILDHWPLSEVAAVVVTDGERILGLGDLGVGGMGISIGKVSLYVAAAGVHPARTLPICLDVGTDNEELKRDRLYLGLRRPRVRGDAYVRLVEDLLETLARRFPRAFVQFEDFATPNALALLDRFRGRFRCFNDDVQGTGAVTKAVVLAALRRTGGRLAEQRVLVAGAGSAGIGIAQALREARPWVVDHHGLLTADRADLTREQREFAREERGGTLLDVARRIRPHVLVGVTGRGGLFGREVLATLDGERPLVLPLSNPTPQSECTPEDALEATGGRALVATGSPFPGTPQCNNVYVFPGLGLGLIVSGAERVTDGMLSAAAETLASLAPADGLLPPLSRIREVSRAIARAVSRRAFAEGQGDPCGDPELERRLEEHVWEPRYLPYRAV